MAPRTPGVGTSGHQRRSSGFTLATPGSTGRPRTSSGLNTSTTPLSASRIPLPASPASHGSGQRVSSLSHRSSIPGAWVNYPYRALYDYNADPTTGGHTISISEGTEGYILSQEANGWSEVTVGRTNTQGWVPTSYIKAGPRPRGDYNIRHDFPVAKYGIRDSDLDSVPESMTEKIVVGLVAAIKNNQDQMPFMSPGVRALINDDQKRYRFCQNMIRGAVPGYRSTLADPNSTIQDFIQKVRAVDSSNKNSGHYMRVTSGFEDERDPETYTGSTTRGFSLRKREHINLGHGYEGFNACMKSAQEADELELYPICLMNPGDQWAMFLGEQIWTLANGTYKPSFYDHKLERATDATASLDETVREVLKEVTFREQAALLISIASEVFLEIDFEPLSRRESFGTHAGLNHASPIAEYEHWEKTTWIKLTQPGVKDAYYRDGMALLKPDKQGSTVLTPVTFFTGDNAKRRSIKACFVKGTTPPVGTTVYTVFEIMHNGTHHTPWARLGDIGIHADWSDANRIALRTDWQEQGVWYSRYHQVTACMQLENQEDPGCLNSYNKAMALIRYFHQYDQRDPPSWYLDSGSARLKSLTFDVFTQTIHLRDVAPTGISLPRPRLKSTNELRQELRSVGCLNVGGQWGVRAVRPGDNPRLAKSAGRQPTRCDACYMYCKYDGHIKRARDYSGMTCTPRKDENENDTNTCSNCYLRGLVCSWTALQSITQQMIRAVNFTILKPERIIINAPVMVEAGQGDDTVDDEDDEARIDEDKDAMETDED